MEEPYRMKEQLGVWGFMDSWYNKFDVVRLHPPNLP